MTKMKLNTSSSLTWIMIFIIHLLCICSLASSAPLDLNTTNQSNDSIAEVTTGVISTDVATTVELGLSTADTEIPTSESSAEVTLDKGPVLPGAPVKPAKQALTTPAKPAEPSTTLQPAVQTTPKQPSKQSPNPTIAPDKRGDDEQSETMLANIPTTTLSTTQAPIITTTKTATTTQATTTQQKITTQKPRTNKPTELNVDSTTLLAKTAAPVQSTVTTRVPVTEGHQRKTDGNQPRGTTDKPTVTSNPDSGTDKSDKGDTANNSVFSKLMLPVVLGIVAAILIICFAYGIRACKKKDRSGRGSKMMHNGKDQEMRGNFDRMKLLADSSEDEF